jgi:hypothetical protein
MKLAPILTVLEMTTSSDVPTTKPQARKLASRTEAALEDVRTYLDELETRLSRAEEAADELTDADGDDREGAHTELVEAVDELHDKLKEIVIG